MKRRTLLDVATDGCDVLAYVQGRFSFRNGSNLRSTLDRLGLSPADCGRTYAVAVGARRQRLSEGFKMAVVVPRGVL